MGRLARGLFYSGPLLIWLALIFYLSSKAGSSGTTASLIATVLSRLAPGLYESITAFQWEWLNYLVRKAAHLTEYFVLLLLAIRALQHGQTKLRWGTFLGALALGMGWACTDEYHQSFVPGRTPLLQDVFIDWAGCCAAAIVILLWFAEKSVERSLKASWDRERPTPSQRSEAASGGQSPAGE